MAPLLEVRNLCINFGATQAVADVDLHLEEGEVLGFAAVPSLRTDRTKPLAMVTESTA
jgi:ABC-type phosphonate transport system ATPase subunit